MASTYVTKAGDMLDEISWRFYGATDNRVVEQVLEANRGLADLGEQLPAGVSITLPEISKQAEQQGVRLWD